MDITRAFSSLGVCELSVIWYSISSFASCYAFRVPLNSYGRMIKGEENYRSGSWERNILIRPTLFVISDPYQFIIFPQSIYIEQLYYVFHCLCRGNGGSTYCCLGQSNFSLSLVFKKSSSPKIWKLIFSLSRVRLKSRKKVFKFENRSDSFVIFTCVPFLVKGGKQRKLNIRK